MEKTKKLIGHIIVTLAVLCMLFAGMQMQQTPSYAAGNVVSSIENKPAPGFNAAQVTTNTGAQITKQDGTPLTADEINTQLVVKSYQATRDAGIAKKTAIETAKTEVSTQNTAVAAKVEEALTALKTANKIDDDIQAKDLTTTDIFDVELTGDVLAAAQDGGIEVTFKVGADIALLKTAEGWETLEIVNKSEPNGQAPLVWEYASNILGAQNETTVILKKSGIVVLQSIVKSEAPTEPDKDGEKCCDCCSENCPFCPALCKDGKCYCWTMYLVIVLGVILVALIVALIIVKSKAKKVVDVQETADEVAAQDESEQVADQQDQNEDIK